MQLTRRRALALLAAPAFIAGRARAQTSALNWPQRPVKFIIPFGPGAGADIGARLIQEKLSARGIEIVINGTDQRLVAQDNFRVATVAHFERDCFRTWQQFRVRELNDT